MKKKKIGLFVCLWQGERLKVKNYIKFDSRFSRLGDQSIGFLEAQSSANHMISGSGSRPIRSSVLEVQSVTCFCCLVRFQAYFSRSGIQPVKGFRYLPFDESEFSALGNQPTTFEYT
jgi:hypothetical protein